MKPSNTMISDLKAAVMSKNTHSVDIIKQLSSDLVGVEAEMLTIMDSILNLILLSYDINKAEHVEFDDLVEITSIKMLSVMMAMTGALT